VKINKKISNAVGFTESEGLVILFFLALTIAGGVYKLVDNTYHVAEKFTYQRQDSLYQAIISASREKQGYRLNVPDILSGAMRDSSMAADSTSPEAATVEKLPKGSLGIVNINKATIPELATLPGIGIKTAADIVAYRKTIRQFTSTEQLKDVKGIGEKKFDKIKSKIALR
jgi:competence ComEA-like helix-hairpin-helix protein